MIEEQIAKIIAQYGLLGIMFSLMIFAIRYMAKRDEERDSKMTAVVQNNTVALTRFVETTKKCEVKK